MNYRLHQLFDTTDCIEEIIHPPDTNVFQERFQGSFKDVGSLAVPTPGGNNRNPSYRRSSSNYQHSSPHHGIQHLQDLSTSRRERSVGTRLADIQLSERGYRGGDDDNLMIGGVSSGGMIELRDLGASSNRNGSGTSYSIKTRTGYENPRRDSNASLTDLTKTSYVEESKTQDSVEPSTNQFQVPSETITISAETIRERVAAASASRVAAARAVLASATSNLRRRGGNRNNDVVRGNTSEEQSNKFDLQVDLHSDPTTKENFDAWRETKDVHTSNKSDILEEVFGRRTNEIDKVNAFLYENKSDKDLNNAFVDEDVNDLAVEGPRLKSDDVVVIVDESSPEHHLHSGTYTKLDRKQKLMHGQKVTVPDSTENSRKPSGAHQDATQKKKKLSISAQERRQSRSAMYLEDELINEDNQNPNTIDNNPPLNTFLDSTQNHADVKGDVTDTIRNKSLLDCEITADVTSERQPRRRFSNLSNLAQSLPSTSSSASALMHSRAGLGSVDLASILNRGQSRKKGRESCKQEREEQGAVPVSSFGVRRTQSALVTCSPAAVLCNTITTNSMHKSSKAHEKSKVKLKGKDRFINRNIDDTVKSDSENFSEEEEREIISGSRSPLLTRSRSFERVSSGQMISGTVSFDPTAGDSFRRPLETLDHKNRECSIYTSDMDMETYQAELQDATNALLVARKYLIACDKSETNSDGRTISSPKVPSNTCRKNSWSAGQTKTKDVEHTLLPETNYFSLDNTQLKDIEGKPSYLGVVGPLDWLFSDSEPEPGPSSPKFVHQQGNDSNYNNSNNLEMLPETHRQRNNKDSCSSQGSSGTDTETRSLLTKEDKIVLKDGLKIKKRIGDNADITSKTHLHDSKSIDLKATGAIPKKRANQSEALSTFYATNEDQTDENAYKTQESEDAEAESGIYHETHLQETSNNFSVKSVPSSAEPHHQRRSFKLLSRKRPPTPPTGSNGPTLNKEEKEKGLLLESRKICHPLSLPSTEGSSPITTEPSNDTTAELKQRILEILSSSSTEECQRELEKLKKELESRNRQMAAALSAAQLPAADLEAQQISATLNRNVGSKYDEEIQTSSSHHRRRRNAKTSQRPSEDFQVKKESVSQQHRGSLPNADEETEISHHEKRRRRRAERRRLEREERAKLAKDGNEIRNNVTTTTAATIPSTPALVNILAAGSTVDNTGTHLATDHEDTTEGAIHCFQDEFGNWHSYTFGQESSGTARTVASASAPTNTMSTLASTRPQVSNIYSSHGVVAPLAKSSRANSNASLDSFTSGLTVILDSPAMSFQPKRASSINNSGAMEGEDVDEYSQSGGTIGSIAGSSITNRSRYERRGSSSDRRAEVGSSYIGPRSTGGLSHQLSVIDRAFDRQQSNTTNSTLGSISGTFRSHRSPLHLFAESLLERTRLAASAATTAVGNAHSQVIK